MLAQNRANRWYNLTITAQRANAGPLSSSYLKTSERFDRPVIRTFQRHPGNQVPEAPMTAKVNQNIFLLFTNHEFRIFFCVSLGNKKPSTIS